ncbi:hypothetical protein CSA56_06540 [candidate division KSB3 bacterium]|uniref:Uncharacterized protein n=1 Tax=candidate division KSB3 bacterium TaxID=2044937 RepID=A0A2G6KGS6_9BACT|nr:MAG: hypothetical protein CSA56_06540 [candidate division KSB3 bacterium]
MLDALRHRSQNGLTITGFEKVVNGKIALDEKILPQNLFDMKRYIQYVRPGVRDTDVIVTIG